MYLKLKAQVVLSHQSILYFVIWLGFSCAKKKAKPVWPVYLLTVALTAHIFCVLTEQARVLCAVVKYMAVFNLSSIFSCWTIKSPAKNQKAMVIISLQNLDVAAKFMQAVFTHMGTFYTCDNKVNLENVFLSQTLLQAIFVHTLLKRHSRYWIVNWGKKHPQVQDYLQTYSNLRLFRSSPTQKVLQHDWVIYFFLAFSYSAILHNFLFNNLCRPYNKCKYGGC